MKTNYSLIKEISTVKSVKVLNPMRYFRTMEGSVTQMNFNNDLHLNEEVQKALFNFKEKKTDRLW